MEKTLSIVVVKRKPTKLSIRQRSMWLNHYQLFVLWSPPPPKKKKINSQLLWFRRSVNTGYRLLRKTPKLTLQGDWSPRCSLPGKESLCYGDCVTSCKSKSKLLTLQKQLEIQLCGGHWFFHYSGKLLLAQRHWNKLVRSHGKFMMVGAKMVSNVDSAGRLYQS